MADKKVETHKVVTLPSGNTHSKHEDETQAAHAAEVANKQATELGIKATYEVQPIGSVIIT